MSNKTEWIADGITLPIADHGRRQSESTHVFLVAIAAYVALQTLSVLASSGLLKAASYAYAFVMVLFMCVRAAYLMKAREEPVIFTFPLLLYLYGCVCSALFHFSTLDYGTVIKMMLAPLFLWVGVAFETQNRFQAWGQQTIRLIFGLLVALPILLWVFQLVSGRIEFGEAGEVSIFANRNNAALYAVAIVALLNVLRPQPLNRLYVYLFIGVAFGTLGVLLAVLTSIVLAVGNLRTVTILCLAIIAVLFVAYFTPFEFGIFGRFQHVVATIKLIASGRIDIATVSYGNLVEMLNTKDLSFIFRIKHWLNLWSIYEHGPIENLIFGMGVGSSVWLSDAGLVPHNDYLRMLIEGGPVTFIGFASLIVLILRSCGRRWELVPLLTIALYFFTENLIGNFAAMAIFFFSSGVMAYRFRYGHLSKS